MTPSGRLGSAAAALLLSAAAVGCSATPGMETAVQTPSPIVRLTPTPPAPPTAESPTATPLPSATPAPTPAVLVAAGDVSSCNNDGDEATARLVETHDGVVAMLGDSAYDRGSPADFANCYDPTWGRFKERTRPAVGNHEYLTSGAAGYFDYFGPAAGEPGRGYYSYDLGAWHIVVLNSMCWEIGGCGLEAPQTEWLAADLRDHPALCTLAYWHYPRFSSGRHGNSDVVARYWDLLYQAGAEVVLTGHDHDYERFAPQDAQGTADPGYGVREFVVGTGGFSHYPFPGSPIANSEARDASSYGVLVLQLFPDRYEWEFVPAPGGTFSDSGEGPCHAPPG